MKTIDIFPWDDNFNTGLPKVDEQHRKLVQLLNTLASHVAFRADMSELNRVFDELAEYTVYHFQTEEAIWGEFLPGDQDEIEHKQTHRKFVETVLRLKREQATRPIEQVAEETLGFLARWLASHILETDRRMAYAVLAIKDGLNLDDAKRRAAVQMSGATRVLIDIILSIYDSLSTNTLHLMRELAERKRREEELVEAKLRAEAANFTKSRFLANMSHEVRTPLNGILGIAQLLLQQGLAEHERESYLRMIIDSGTTLLSLFNGILDLSRIEAGNLALQTAVFDPRQLVEEVHGQFVEAMRQKGLQFPMELSDGLSTTYAGDAQRLRQMLASLLSNAAKFTHAGAVRVAVREIGRDDEGAELEFAVSDTGIGMPAEKRALVFQPFTQVDDSATRQFGGAGIGLSIVRSLAELMQGQVGVDSEPGQGSRFWFRVRVGVPA